MPTYTTASTTNSAAWRCWADNTTGTNSTAWLSWTNNTSSTNWSVTSNVWAGWNSGTLYNQRAREDAVQAHLRISAQRAAQIAETEEQRTARRLAQEAQETARRIEREIANRRAEALLHAHLTEEQRAQLLREDWFLIVSSTGKTYRINRGRSANVDVLDSEGRVVRSLCAHPADPVPDADTMLAQALMLRFEEDAFLKKANVHPIHHGFRRRPLPAAEIATVTPIRQAA